MEQKGLQKILEVDSCLETMEVFADKQRINQVLINLLSNALKFTLSGFIKVKLQKLSKEEGGTPSSNALEEQKDLIDADQNVA